MDDIDIESLRKTVAINRGQSAEVLAGGVLAWCDAFVARLAPVQRDDLTRIRAAGWMVAVHNDYKQNGELFTFWLFTHPDGRWLKGEGRTDAEALALVVEQL